MYPKAEFDHLVFAPDDPLDAVEPDLVVFLPGTEVKNTSRYNKFARTVARTGFRVIVLAYNNVENPGQLCSEFEHYDDEDCYYDVLLEKITGGVDLGDWDIDLDVTPADSVENRLWKLLDHLAGSAPGYDWHNYYDPNLDPHGGGILWSNIIVTGHSQGGTVSSVISIENEVARVIGIPSSGPSFWPNGLDEPPMTAPWALECRPTPGNKIFLFYHRREHAFTRGRAPDIAEAFGLGPMTQVEENVEDPPVPPQGAGSQEDMVSPVDFDCSRNLYTDVEYAGWACLNVHPLPPGCNPAHPYTVVNLNTDETGRPRFDDAWIYLLTHEITIEPQVGATCPPP